MCKECRLLVTPECGRINNIWNLLNTKWAPVCPLPSGKHAPVSTASPTQWPRKPPRRKNTHASLSTPISPTSPSRSTHTYAYPHAAHSHPLIHLQTPIGPESRTKGALQGRCSKGTWGWHVVESPTEVWLRNDRIRATQQLPTSGTTRWASESGRKAFHQSFPYRHWTLSSRLRNRVLKWDGRTHELRLKAVSGDWIEHEGPNSWRRAFTWPSWIGIFVLHSDHSPSAWASRPLRRIFAQSPQLHRSNFAVKENSRTFAGGKLS